MVQLAAAASRLPQLLDSAKLPGIAAMLAIDKEALPVFVNVTS